MSQITTPTTTTFQQEQLEHLEDEISKQIEKLDQGRVLFFGRKVDDDIFHYYFDHFQRSKKDLPGVVGVRLSSDGKGFTFIMRRVGKTSTNTMKAARIMYDRNTRQYSVLAKRRANPPEGKLLSAPSVIELLELFAAEYENTYVMR